MKLYLSDILTPAVPAGDGGLLITHHTMILVTIAVLMADTTPLTSTDTVTAVGIETYTTNDDTDVINLLLLLNSPITSTIVH